MKAAIPVVSGGAGRAASGFTTGSGTLDVFYRGATSALVNRVWRVCDERARKYPNAALLMSNVAAAVGGQRSGDPTQLYGLANFSDAERKLIDELLGEGEVTGWLRCRTAVWHKSGSPCMPESGACASEPNRRTNMSRLERFRRLSGVPQLT
uniref:ID32 n=1 Tax=Bradyrhizobium japonicum TaxID=375 RepID=Q9ANQ3_BRAJP|nr:ID32 [Bradyrhizobium japonicum]